MPPSAKKRAELDAIAQKAAAMRSSGATFESIGASFSPPMSRGNVVELLKRRGLLKPVFPARKCALLECTIVFTPKQPQQKYCCRKHLKRGSSRDQLGLTTDFRPCRLPDCHEQVLCANTASTKGRFCSTRHAKRHASRNASGFYDRLINRTACAVCGVWGPVEIHHIVPRGKGGTDETENLIPLCSNHHQMLHCGLAEFRDGVYTDLRETMRAAELSRRARRQQDMMSTGDT